MDVFVGNHLILIQVNGRSEKFWVYQLIKDAIHENLDRVRHLDWFNLSHLLGEETWRYLAARDQLQSAGRCFKYIVENDAVSIEVVSKPSKEAQRYKVIESKLVPGWQDWDVAVISA
ncbi:protein of unknown function [Methylophilus rhizosphaerae]|uniref:Uncharacterized protein n=1 Tax=Methylophilus rhizosphaerae TaxID=492660 RepID=A0A1G9CPI0_9PROT|nr:DUF1413 domain-containing protein [Methylophilus rhizosphaerae]SDK53562.1 protein of unknown function [Methylophilus rhizosphaerae]